MITAKHSKQLEAARRSLKKKRLAVTYEQKLSAAIKRFFTKVSKTKACWNWTAGLNSYGYGQFKFCGKPISAHRFSYIAFVKSVPKGLLVCHTCDNRKCVNPNHLWLGTEYDNAHDCVSKGRQTRLKGVSNGQSILTELQVLEIRQSKSSSYKIAPLYNVAASTIRSIRNKARWAHL